MCDRVGHLRKMLASEVPTASAGSGHQKGGHLAGCLLGLGGVLEKRRLG